VTLRYLTILEVIELHDLMIQRTDSPPAPLRDMGLLDSAVMRPQIAAYYEDADLVRQAVLLITGVSQAQAFVDGNKRAAFAAGDVFLRLNGSQYSGDPIELGRQLEMIASRTDSLEAATVRFEEWLRERVSPLSS
jgi:death-on-curing protein